MKKLVFLGLGLVIIGLSSSIYLNFKALKSFKKIATKARFSDLLPEVTPTPTLTPTPGLPTATPTLSPKELAEIRQKNFADYSQKYGPCSYVPVLMYHHVMDTQAAKDIGATNLNVPPDVFRQQMDYLIGKGYQVVGLDDMVNLIRSGGLPSKPVVLTFDDGYNDFYDQAFPILKEKNFKATLFVISQFTGGGRYVNWNQVKEMADSGLILIGDHTLSHLSLPNLSQEEITNQIMGAKSIIEDHLGRSTKFFAYPYGSINSLVEQVLKENNFLGAVVTTNKAPQCLGLPYEFSRVRIGGGSLSRYGL